MNGYFTIGLLVVLGVACALLGCKSTGTDNVQKECKALISPENLPSGWRLLPTSEMPPIDKTPWWTKNPQLLEIGRASCMERV